MLTSSIRDQAGRPVLYIDGRPAATMAYTTYFEERSRYEDFLAAGYRIFFVNLSFTKKPINNFTGFTPFRVGVFEDPTRPDYSEFEAAVQKILEKCPDAVIFPRIYISMPGWWTESHPDQCIVTPKGGKRELLFSEGFRQDGTQMLTQVVQHIQNAAYAHRIGGWMICGGQTQEWFHHDSNGSLSPAATVPFQRWMKARFGVENAKLPQPEDFAWNGSHPTDEIATQYARFCNLEVAKTVEHFARVIKEETERRQVVGAFYGYAYQSNGTPLLGTHGLGCLLDSDVLDFFSAPNAYSGNRAFGIDWNDMIPVDSLKCHGKLAFIECDIRTFLTTGVQRARPGEYPGDIYGDALWAGPPTAELSRYALQKCFCHQLTKASAIWWFDMWGGWYADPLLMEALTEMKRLYDHPASVRTTILAPEVVFFADEAGIAKMRIDSPQIKALSRSRTNMGVVGAPGNTFMVEDAQQALVGCKAAIFPCATPSEAGRRAMALCEERGIPYLCASPEHPELSVSQIRSVLRAGGVHVYIEENDVVYAGNGYVALHSAVGGRKVLHLPGIFRLTPIFGTDAPAQVTDKLVFDLPENGTALFSVNEE